MVLYKISCYLILNCLIKKKGFKDLSIRDGSLVVGHNLAKVELCAVVQRIRQTRVQIPAVAYRIRTIPVHAQRTREFFSIPKKPCFFEEIPVVAFIIIRNDVVLRSGTTSFYATEEEFEKFLIRTSYYIRVERPDFQKSGMNIAFYPMSRQPL